MIKDSSTHSCVCGETTSPGVVHRWDKPCYVPSEVTAKRPCAYCADPEKGALYFEQTCTGCVKRMRKS
jgi:hypothetical protein